MKQLTYFFIAVLALSILSCQDAKDDVRENISDLAFYRNIGKQIPNEQGQRWVELYRHENDISTNGRIDLLGYSLSEENLAAMASSVTGFTGVAFHHATDYLGRHHFLAIPVGESLQVWEASADKVIIDTNTDMPISGSTARLWAANYEASHPNNYWFHFFGKNVFDQMNALPFFDAMLIEPALSDLNLTPQLLLIVSELNLGILGISLGRTNDFQTMVFDASSPCPPCGVQ